MIKKILYTIFVSVNTIISIVAQNAPPAQTEKPNLGVSVSPSTLRFNVKPGLTQTKTIRISNETNGKKDFQVAFQDYGLGKKGQSNVAVSEDYKNALSKYIVVSPTLLELGAGESKLISVTLDIPPGDAYAIAMWTTLILDQVIERDKLEIPNPSDNTLGLGIKASIGFGVNIFQNPPNVIVNSVDIQAMKYVNGIGNENNAVVMVAKNSGDGIGYCLYYIELTNLLTGKQSKLKVKQFGIFPGYEKEFRFDLPKELEKGKYSVLAVLDFGDKEELRTAELDFTID